jgi:hypothetical protein
MQKILLSAIALGFAATTAANATVFGGTSSFTDNGGSSSVNFIATALTNPFATSNITAGQTYAFPSFATIQGTDTGGGGFFGQTYTDNITLSLIFNQPGSATDNQGGTGSETTQAFFGQITGYSGEIDWNGDTHFDSTLGVYYAQDQITFADGAVALVDIYDTILSGSGNVRSGNVEVKIVDVKDPIPEPAGIAMLGIGLLGLGGVVRRRQPAV